MSESLSFTVHRSTEISDKAKEWLIPAIQKLEDIEQEFYDLGSRNSHNVEKIIGLETELSEYKLT